jgi:hypothetical protein
MNIAARIFLSSSSLRRNFLVYAEGRLKVARVAHSNDRLNHLRRRRLTAVAKSGGPPTGNSGDSGNFLGVRKSDPVYFALPSLAS